MTFPKTLLKILIAILIVVLLGIITLVLFVNPERLKPILIQKVKLTTGRELVMDGHLSWTFFPWLGVKAGHIALGNPEGFPKQSFMEVNSAQFGVQFFPLLKGKVEAGSIELHGVQVNLIKNANGQNNWTFNSDHSKISVSPNASHTSNGAKSLSLAITQLNIDDANVRYQDLQTQQAFDLRHFDLLASNINFSHEFPVKSSFDIDATKPAMKGHFTFNATTSLSPISGEYAFQNAVLTADIDQANKHFPIQISGNLMANLPKETLIFEKFESKFANATETGSMQINHLLSDPIATGHFEYKPFDLRALLTTIGVDTTNLQTASGVSGQMNFTATQSSISANGILHADTIQAAKLQMKDLLVHYRLHDGMLDFTPMTANLYEGKATAEARVDFNAHQPQVNLQLTLANIQAGPLMQDLAGKHDVSLTGLGNVTLSVTTSGTEETIIMRNLNGNAHFSFTNGFITGVDLGNLLDHAAAFVKGQPQPEAGSGKTAFGSLTASAVIESGIIKNQDLLLDASRFTVSGGGSIDLVLNKMDYSLQMLAKKNSPDQKDTLANLYGLPVPLTVSGALDHPSVRIDIPRLSIAIAKRQFQNAAGNTLQQQLGNKVPENAGQLLNSLLGK